MDVIALLVPTKTSTISCDQMSDPKGISDAHLLFLSSKESDRIKRISPFRSMKACMVTSIAAAHTGSSVFKGITTLNGSVKLQRLSDFPIQTLLNHVAQGPAQHDIGIFEAISPGQIHSEQPNQMRKHVKSRTHHQ